MLTRRALLEKAVVAGIGLTQARHFLRWVEETVPPTATELEFISSSWDDILREHYLPPIREQLNRELLLLRQDMRRDLNRQFYGEVEVRWVEET